VPTSRFHLNGLSKQFKVTSGKNMILMALVTAPIRKLALTNPDKSTDDIKNLNPIIKIQTVDFIEAGIFKKRENACR
jgi:hypothetical protein